MKIGMLLVCIGLLALVLWMRSAHPSSITAESHYYELYATLYETMPVVSIGAVVVGLLFATDPVLQWYRDGRSSVMDQ